MVINWIYRSPQPDGMSIHRKEITAQLYVLLHFPVDLFLDCNCDWMNKTLHRDPMRILEMLLEMALEFTLHFQKNLIT